MDVKIVGFPETQVAVLEHHGPPHLQHETTRRFIEWRKTHGFEPDRHQTYGIHYNDPRNVRPADYRMDLCVSIHRPLEPNSTGILNKTIPGGRCAIARHLGSRENVAAADYLYGVWYPNSGEKLRDFPIFFHYLNVGSHVQEHEMVTDVYLPLQ